MAACPAPLYPPRRPPAPPRHAAAGANPDFFRTHLLTVLGFAVLALLVFNADNTPALVALLRDRRLRRPTPAGSVSWSLEHSPGGVTLIALTIAALVLAIQTLHPAGGRNHPRPISPRRSCSGR